MVFFLSKFSRKKIAFFVGVGIILLAVLVLVILKTVQSQKNIQTKTTEIEYKNPKTESGQEYSEWKIYENKKYGYSLKYPADWNIFSDEGESDFSEINLEENQLVKQGGAVFWSNKDSIDYMQESKPEDFRLLGLLIYEKSDIDLNQYANLLGFNVEMGTQSIPFEADNLVGKEFFSVGATENEPRSAIIFKDENRFFVFHLGFVGSNTETLKTMEEIVGSFHNINQEEE